MNDLARVPLRHIGEHCTHEVSFFNEIGKLIAVRTIKNTPAYSMAGYLLGVLGKDVPANWNRVSSRRIF